MYNAICHTLSSAMKCCRPFVHYHLPNALPFHSFSFAIQCHLLCTPLSAICNVILTITSLLWCKRIDSSIGFLYLQVPFCNDFAQVSISREQTRTGWPTQTVTDFFSFIITVLYIDTILHCRKVISKTFVFFTNLTYSTVNVHLTIAKYCDYSG